ncbi:helix-turn-helix transcriptional regulator [Streptomyces sp. DSM 44915]|uniref:Helix-turn-helix transcriptional regulator n=1 Tax=Streptomyces chisholmiae TaxID=3075540 RepID=A0ABU2JT49_9ACTN|nr:helix-turn-helix transcriptional regulator [Streptomyces sp. DSM 44915]MDT0268158.1 helix-turn-helix transcriptional regulator [Streptomyces sp. DSM 44915]
MSRADDPTLNRRRLRVELRRARERAGLTQHEAAGALEWSISKIIRIEKGTVGLSVTDLRAMVRQYAVADAELVAALEEAARGSKGQPWWTQFRDIVQPPFDLYLSYEGSATSIRAFHPIYFPGFLQTTDYVVALALPVVSPERARRAAELRAARQERLFETEDGPQTHFIVDEAAIRRMIGGPALMRQQLRYVRELATRDRVRLQILPFTAGVHASVDGSFALLGFEDDDDLVNVESLGGTLASRDDYELIARYQECFEDLTERALSDEATLALIDQTLEGLGTN